MSLLGFNYVQSTVTQKYYMQNSRNKYFVTFKLQPILSIMMKSCIAPSKTWMGLWRWYPVPGSCLALLPDLLRAFLLESYLPVNCLVVALMFLFHSNKIPDWSDLRKELTVSSCGGKAWEAAQLKEECVAEVGYYMVDGENQGLSITLQQPATSDLLPPAGNKLTVNTWEGTTDDHNSSVPVTNANSNNKSWSTLMIREGDFKAKWI